MCGVRACVPSIKKLFWTSLAGFAISQDRSALFTPNCSNFKHILNYKLKYKDGATQESTSRPAATRLYAKKIDVLEYLSSLQQNVHHPRQSLLFPSQLLDCPITKLGGVVLTTFHWLWLGATILVRAIFFDSINMLVSVL